MSQSSAGGNFFQQMFLDLARVVTSSGSWPADTAEQLAVGVATGGTQEPNIEPSVRMRLEELVRLAELHVANVTGLPSVPDGRPLELLAVTRREWISRTLSAWRPLLDAVAASLTTPGAGPPGGPGAGQPGDVGTSELYPGTRSPLEGQGLPDSLGGSADPTGMTDKSLSELMKMMGPGMPGGRSPLEGLDPYGEEGGGPEAGFAAMLEQWFKMMGPVLMALQVGSMLGHLAGQVMGTHDLIVPYGDVGDLLIVAGNVDAVASDWSLDADSVRLLVALREVTYHSVLAREPVRSVLQDLVRSYAAGVQFSGFGGDDIDLEDLSDPDTLGELLSDPSRLLAPDESEKQRNARTRLEVIGSTLHAYVAHVVTEVAGSLGTSFVPVQEAFRRRRLDRDPSYEAAERFFGLYLDEAKVEAGRSFVEGVVERAGAESLRTLWLHERNLPTAAEFEAPGLWLERIALQGDGEDGAPPRGESSA